MEVSDLPVPEPKTGEVRIKVAAATVNPTDVGFRSGRQAAQLNGLEPPYIAGMELAGVIDAVGGGTSWQRGERVLAIVEPRRAAGGAQQEFVVVPDASVTRIPDGVGDVEAATLPMNGLTVRSALDGLALQPGQWLAVTGAAGAVGAYAVEIGVNEGLRVVAVASPGDEAMLRQMGAELFVPSGDDAMQRIRDLVPGGVDGMIDAAVLNKPAFAAIKDGGGYATVRGYDGESERRITIHNVRAADYNQNTAALDGLAKLVADGKLTLRVAETYPPERTGEAQDRLMGGGVRGRLVIVF
jgi:NADPH:quinone reductase-like Zn-dependent oxidoreductase